MTRKTPADGDTVDISGYIAGDIVQILDGFSVTVTGTNTDIEIRCAGNVILTIDDLTITNTSSGSPIWFSGTGNTLMLDGASTLVGGNACPGIRVEGSTALTINSTTGGSVTATGGPGGAGIGGSVSATGGDRGAGIGGGTLVPVERSPSPVEALPRMLDDTARASVVDTVVMVKRSPSPAGRFLPLPARVPARILDEDKMVHQRAHSPYPDLLQYFCEKIAAYYP
jgi:hypothetical protein